MVYPLRPVGVEEPEEEEAPRKGAFSPLRPSDARTKVVDNLVRLWQANDIEITDRDAFRADLEPKLSHTLIGDMHDEVYDTWYSDIPREDFDAEIGWAEYEDEKPNPIVNTARAIGERAAKLLGSKLEVNRQNLTQKSSEAKAKWMESYAGDSPARRLGPARRRRQQGQAERGDLRDVRPSSVIQGTVAGSRYEGQGRQRRDARTRSRVGDLHHGGRPVRAAVHQEHCVVGGRARSQVVGRHRRPALRLHDTAVLRGP